MINTVAGTALQATVRDAGSNPLAGVTVTFTAPASGATARFSGLATATATTNINGVATAPALTANGTEGSYTVTASVSGVAAPANFNLTNTTVPFPLPSLAGSVTSSTAAANLATEGTADWIHWGDAVLNRKAGGGSQISTYTPVGSGTVLGYPDDLRPSELDRRNTDCQQQQQFQRRLHLGDRQRV